MDVSELLGYQPAKPQLPKSTEKRPASFSNESAVKKPKQNKPSSNAPVEEKMKLLETLDNEPAFQGDMLDESGVRRLATLLDKRVIKNQEMRIKHPESPEKFMQSEIELNDAIHEFHSVATHPHLYPILVDLNCFQSFVNLLSHENTDIALAVIDVLQELTDVDEDEEGASALVDSLVELKIISQLISCLDRLDENVKEDADGIQNALAIIENLNELKPEICASAVDQGLIQWLLKKLRAKNPFDANKLYASEIMCICIQENDDNKRALGELEGIDVILQQLAHYKRHDPQSGEEIEYMENLFSGLCSALLHPGNRSKFLNGEGLQLMNLMLREKKLSRYGALKTLAYALNEFEGRECCQKYVDILGIRAIFPLFMKTPKGNRKLGYTADENEERILSVIASLLRNTSGVQRQRVLLKFVENDHEKVERLMELHFKYFEAVEKIDKQIEEERKALMIYGDIDSEQEAEFYFQRLDAGLFSLQLVDYMILEICSSCASSVEQRISQILSMRGISRRSICKVMREYANTMGDALSEDVRFREKQRLLTLIDKFA